MKTIEIPQAAQKILPFRVSAPQEAIDDLRARLQATRFPNEQPVKDWSQGVPLAQAKALVEYWESRYDFSAHTMGDFTVRSKTITVAQIVSP